ncbi:MAG TPA: hypothetical protein VHW64_07725 [Nocardioides sp.]|jgi:hypothetical protein|uniref:hypothetical protein n=1 Tax=Nocardioides sp. TaxID=35761 RepID=UPI002E37D0E9|nr:hypothetical protein [Nocardioides sp.]HEX3930576.1 hypothetical protein [Nocardioides sp.]
MTSSYALETGYLTIAAGGSVTGTASDASKGPVDFGAETSEPRHLHVVVADQDAERARFTRMAERARRRAAETPTEPDSDEHARRQLEITTALTAGQQQALGLE